MVSVGELGGCGRQRLVERGRGRVQGVGRWKGDIGWDGKLRGDFVHGYAHTVSVRGWVECRGCGGVEQRWMG